MSLDVYICEYGYNDPACPVDEYGDPRPQYLYSADITHNLGAMAQEAGVYHHLWRPDEIGIAVAGDLVLPLTKAIMLMYSDPARFRAHNSPNGWGMYENFLPWVIKYRNACEQYSKGFLHVSR